MFKAGLWVTLRIMSRARGVQFKALVVMPVMTILPYTIMAHGFAPSNLSIIFACNLAWAGIYFGVFEGFLARAAVLESTKLDTLRITGGRISSWLAGQAVGIYLVFVPSALVGWILAKTMTGVACSAQLMLVVLVVSFVGQMGIGGVILALQLRFSRTFHLINLGMDVVQAGSCVLYPLTVLPVVLVGVSSLSPITWGMESLRNGSMFDFTIFCGACLILWWLGAYAVSRSIRRIAERGGLHG